MQYEYVTFTKDARCSVSYAFRFPVVITVHEDVIDCFRIHGEESVHLSVTKLEHDLRTGNDDSHAGGPCI
jgi:hypothetical protein